MAKTNYESVDEYLAAQPEAARAPLRRVRRAIKEGMPDAQEAISYQIPAYKLAGRAALYFAGWKAHYSLYPVTAPLLSAFKDELAPYEVEKGTIRFPLAEHVPTDLIERLARFRARELAERPHGKRSRAKNPA